MPTKPARVVTCALAALLVALSTCAASAGATVFLSPNGSDTASCTQAAPCRSFDRGFRVSPAGGEVELAGGNYGSQTIANAGAKGARVVLRPAAGAAVSAGYLKIDNTDDVEIRAVTTSGWSVQGGADHVILRDVKALDATSGGYVGGANDLQILGGEIGRIDPEDGLHLNNGYGTNTNVTIDGLFMHDLTRDRDPSSHDDCIQTGDVTNLVIRNSRFVNCGTQGIFLNPFNGGATKGITLENNWFGTAQLGYNIIYVGEAQNVVMRNNSITGSMYIDKGTASGVQMVNNIINVDSYTCSTLVDGSTLFDYNLTPGTCSGATHHQVKSGLTAQFVNGTTSSSAAFDLHLKAGAAAIDKGSPTNSPGTDFDRYGRPVGAGYDIGADEYGNTPATPATPTTPTPPTTPVTPTPPTTPSGGGTPGTTGATPTSAKAAVLATLPPEAATALARSTVVDAGSKAPLTGAGLDHGTLCRAARKGCRTTTTLRIVVSKATKANLVFRQVRPGKKAKMIRVTGIRLKKGVNRLALRAKGLRAARYHLVVRAPNGAGIDLPFTVRK